MYTYIGEVIVSVNPYRKLDIYNEECILEYMDKEPYERPPHIYAVAESAYHDMKKYRKGSCILITGQSIKIMPESYYSDSPLPSATSILLNKVFSFL